jgi:hypothetical protein
MNQRNHKYLGMLGLSWNFVGVQHVYNLPYMWNLKTPTRINVFMCLFSQNKFLIRYNVRKRGMPNVKNVIRVNNGNNKSSIFTALLLDCSGMMFLQFLMYSLLALNL